MSEFRIGDKVELNCTREMFEDKVGGGSQILRENFNKEGIATVSGVSHTSINLEEVVNGTGEGCLLKKEQKYIKKVQTPKVVSKTVTLSLTDFTSEDLLTELLNREQFKGE